VELDRAEDTVSVKEKEKERKERRERMCRSRAPALLASGLARCARGDWARGADAFARCHGVAPDEPLVSLCVGVAAAHHATESDFDSGEAGETARRAAAVKAVAFFQRARESRAACSPTSAGEQEGDYNLARGLHQMGLPHLAVPVYEKVLDGKTRAGVPAAPAVASLAFEAAHNLALIYKNAGALSLARDVLRAHATV
jgi:general transcription factor 3C polypeptide 3 (transcription factor C subunit 4)